MSYLKEISTLRGDNYSEWRKKVDMALCIAEVDWVLEEPQPAAPAEPVREADEYVRAGTKSNRVMKKR